MQQLLLLDEQLFLWFNNLGQPAWDPFWRFITEPTTWIPLYLFLLILLVWQLGWRRFVPALFAIALTVWGCDTGSVALFKKQVKRPRPCHQEHLQPHMRLAAVHCGGAYGFVSSHAANTFGIAVLVGGMLTGKWRYLRYILFLWAGASAYSRVYLGVHFPGDVLAGGLYGAGIAALVGFAYRRFISRIGYE